MTARTPPIRLTALAGASFFLILSGFAIQRLLVDLIAGLTMFVERWYSIGDTIAVPTLELQGVVEEASAARGSTRSTSSPRPSSRIRLRASVAPGREWLVEGFLSDLLKERAGDLIAHGPVVMAVDDRASRSFARASAATRWSGRAA